MRKSILLSALGVVFYSGACAQELSKEEKKRLKDELKIYMADLQGYKAHKDDIQITLDSNEAQIKTLKEQLISQTDMRNTLDSYEKQMKEIRTENEQLKDFNDTKLQEQVQNALNEKLDSAMRANGFVLDEGRDQAMTGENAGDSDYGQSGGAGGNKPGSTSGGSRSSGSKPVMRGKDSGSSSTGSSTSSGAATTSAPRSKYKPASGGKTIAEVNTPTEGVVYKIQLGLYKKFNINKYFDDLKYIGYERVDGKNRYVIGYFNDESIAQSFVEDIRKMGIKDAFVSKYVDGKRVYETGK